MMARESNLGPTPIHLEDLNWLELLTVEPLMKVDNGAAAAVDLLTATRLLDAPQRRAEAIRPSILILR